MQQLPIFLLLHREIYPMFSRDYDECVQYQTNNNVSNFLPTPSP
jgi:hypothetical protein